MKYRIVESRCREQFESEVSVLLEHGYDPVGEITVTEHVETVMGGGNYWERRLVSIYRREFILRTDA